MENQKPSFDHNNSIVTPEQLSQIRRLVQDLEWGEFMFHIGCLLAKQADKVERDTPKETALVNCSRTIHALSPFFVECGKFDYDQWGIL